jgi:hypothetical protein
MTPHPSASAIQGQAPPLAPSPHATNQDDSEGAQAQLDDLHDTPRSMPMQQSSLPATPTPAALPTTAGADATSTAAANILSQNPVQLPAPDLTFPSPLPHEQHQQQHHHELNSHQRELQQPPAATHALTELPSIPPNPRQSNQGNSTSGDAQTPVVSMTPNTLSEGMLHMQFSHPSRPLVSLHCSSFWRLPLGLHLKPPKHAITKTCLLLASYPPLTHLSYNLCPGT